MLCRDLGFAHPDHLFSQLTHRQFEDWKDVYALDPWGELRADWRAARLNRAIYDSHPRRKDAPEFPPEERYLLRFEPKELAPPPEPLTPERYKARAIFAWAGAGGGIKFNTETP